MTNLKKEAFRLIVLLGIISLLGDIIYEGGRSAHGQYLNLLGVSAAKVGFIIGLGEFLGYLLRLISGYFADKTKSYWFFVILGYLLLFSVPLIGLTDIWQVVALLIILERIGKGIRTPARDTITSYASKQIGTGYGFGITEFIDQIGGIIGPFLFAFIFIGANKIQNIIDVYQKGYNLFWIPYFLLLFVLFFTYFKFKKPEEFERWVDEDKDKKLTKQFWFYIIFVFLTTAGLINFALIGFHFKNKNILTDSYIPILYALIMGIDAISALLVGRLYDRIKNQTRQEFNLLFLIPLISVFIPFLIFSNLLALVLLGAILLGFVLGMQETIMKAVIADITPIAKRSSSYGVFNLSLGLAFFIGNTLTGYLYDYSILILMIVLATVEILAIPVLFLMRLKKEKNLLK